MEAMSKAERTRQFIIKMSAPIFNMKGYENTSLSDIQEATKLTKGAIYGNFSDKNELAVAAYEYSSSLVLNAINKAIKKTTTAKEALLAYINFYVQNWQSVSETGGCPVLNAAVEADDHLFYMKDNVRKSVKRSVSLLQTNIEKGQANNEFKKEIDAEEFAAFIYTIIEGNILLAKIMNDPKYFKITADRIERIIEQELMA